MNKINFVLPLVLLISCLSIHSYAQTPSDVESKQAPKQNPKEILYQAGEKAVQEEKWDEALKKLEWLNIRYPNSTYVEQAKLSIIVCYIKQKEYEKALEAINTFIFHYPKSKWLDHAVQLKKEVKKVEIKSDTTKTPVDHQEAAGFYTSAQTDIRYERWREALVKLIVIKAFYKETPSTEGATLWMIVCYDKIGKFEQALTTADDFMKCYPNSEWLEQVLEMKRDIIKAEEDFNYWRKIVAAITVVTVFVISLGPRLELPGF